MVVHWYIPVYGVMVMYEIPRRSSTFGAEWCLAPGTYMRYEYEYQVRAYVSVYFPDWFVVSTRLRSQLCICYR